MNRVCRCSLGGAGAHIVVTSLRQCGLEASSDACPLHPATPSPSFTPLHAGVAVISMDMYNQGDKVVDENFDGGRQERGVQYQSLWCQWII